MRKQTWLDKEVSPFWAWFILSVFIVIVYSIYGFEYAVLVSFMLILWHKIVIENKKREANKK